MTDASMMHDWTLKAISVDWIDGTATLLFDGDVSDDVSILADGVVYINIPRREEWGPSASVNEVVGPTVLKNGKNYISIEMQSGDLIEMEAQSISFIS